MSGEHSGHGPTSPRKTAMLSLGALGIVFGDIGTSPLYALRESFHDHGGGHHLAVNEGNIYGILSLIFWSRRTLAWDRGRGSRMADEPEPVGAAPCNGRERSLRASEAGGGIIRR